MKIHIPENLGDSSLRILPDDTYQAVVTDVFGKEAAKSSGNPVAYLKWTLKSECSIEKVRKAKDYETTVGAIVLDTYSLLPQALWRLGNTYLALTGENFPEGDFEFEDVVKIMKENLVGCETKIRIKKEPTPTGADQMKVEEVA